MARLGEGMKELERLDAERREMISKIDLLSRDQTNRFRLILLYYLKYIRYFYSLLIFIFKPLNYKF